MLIIFSLLWVINSAPGVRGMWELGLRAVEAVPRGVGVCRRVREARCCGLQVMALVQFCGGGIGTEGLLPAEKREGGVKRIRTCLWWNCHLGLKEKGKQATIFES